jgi:1,6-anhydro-N-acetylmuramate kinase
MRDRFSKMTIVIAAAAVSGVMSVSVTRTSAQAPAGSSNAPMPSSALKKPWGEPDFQGIWTDETDTPLQRPDRYTNQEFFSEATASRF